MVGIVDSRFPITGNMVAPVVSQVSWRITFHFNNNNNNNQPSVFLPSGVWGRVECM